MRMETLRRLNASYEKEYIYAEDYRLWSALAREGARVMVLSVPVLLYRESSEQVTARHYDVMRNTAQRISYENRKHLAELANQNYIEPAVAESERKLTVIIPFLNEGEEVVNTVASVREFAGDTVDIIVINDFSYDGIDYVELLRPYGVYYYVNFEHKGVGASRDFGVERCRTSYFLLLDAHMRFYEAEVFKTITEMLDADDRQLLCCQSTAIMPDHATGRMIPNPAHEPAYGAFCPMSAANYLPDIKWNIFESDSRSETQEIPVVLGAGYAASCRYWKHLRGLEGLMGYGSDEVYISFKVWLEGGKCVLLKKHAIGHYYRNLSPYLTYNGELAHNSLLISELLLPTRLLHRSYAAAMAKDYGIYEQAMCLLRKSSDLIIDLRNYNKSIFTKTIDDVLMINKLSQRRAYVDAMPAVENIERKYHQTVSATDIDCDKLSIVSGIGKRLLIQAVGSLYHGESDATGRREMQMLLDKMMANMRQDTPLADFADGAIGAGWLLLALFSYGLIDTPEAVCREINDIDRRLTDCKVGELDTKNFYHGAGGVMCYVTARLNANDNQLADNFLSVEFLLQLRAKAREVLKTPDCDLLTYYNAQEFLSALNGQGNDDLRRPEVSDWLLPAENPKSDVGASLLDGVMGQWVLLASSLTSIKSHLNSMANV